MNNVKYFLRMYITVVLTVCTGFWTLIIFFFNYLKNPFANPFVSKLRLLPPAVFIDLKYGMHRYIRVNDTKIHHAESGDSSKPLMIFLHGFPEFWYSWRHQIVEFQKDYWCVAMDIRGFGDSGKPLEVSRYKLEVLVEDVRSLIKYLNREKCILVSHDFGGMVACRIRDQYPEVVSAVVLLASSSIEAWFDVMWNNWSQILRKWYIFLFNLPWIPEKWMLLNDMVFVDKLMLNSDNNHINTDDVECYKYWIGKPTTLTAVINSYRANFMLVSEKKDVKGNIPMLAVHARDDQILDSGVLNVLKEEYPNIETKIVDNVGHCIQQEEPLLVNELIKNFLLEHNLV